MNNKLLLLFLSLSSLTFSQQELPNRIRRTGTPDTVASDENGTVHRIPRITNHEDIQLQENSGVCCIIAKTTTSFTSDFRHHCLQCKCTPNPENQNLDTMTQWCRTRCCACVAGTACAGVVAGGLYTCVTFSGPFAW